LVGNRPVEKSDARAIQSAVMRATGGPPLAGGLAATAMAAADINARVPSVDKTTVADILMVCFLAYQPRFRTYNLTRYCLSRCCCSQGFYISSSLFHSLRS